MLFLGIENVSKRNLKMAGKGDIVEASRRAMALCHTYGIMIVAGAMFGFPDDTEEDIVANYRFLKSIEADTLYCQIVTPYPKTGMRQYLLDEGLVTNPDDLTRYNGMWANVRTRHLSSEELQYLVWYHQNQVMGWWEPSERVRARGPVWTAIWRFAFRPYLKMRLGRLPGEARLARALRDALSAHGGGQSVPRSGRPLRPRGAIAPAKMWEDASRVQGSGFRKIKASASTFFFLP